MVEKGTDSVLEISLDRVSLQSTKVVVETRVRLRQAIDGSVLYDALYSYITPPTQRKRFSDWGKNNAVLFRREMVNACNSLADAIVKDLRTKSVRSRPPLF